MATPTRRKAASPTATPPTPSKRSRGRNNGSSAPPAAVADLAPNPLNPRKPWEGGRREKFAASLREFGDLSGVVFNATTGQLVGGHKRVEEFKAAEGAELQVAERLTAPDAAGTVAYGHVLLPDGTRFAYREVRWSKGKEAAANLAANRWAAEWDWEGVSGVLAAIPEGFDIALTGFPEEEWSPLLAADWTPPAPGEMPEKGEEVPEVDGKEHPHHIGLSATAFAALTRARDEGNHEGWSATILALCADE